MCLYTKQKEPLKLTEKLKVYKAVSKIINNEDGESEVYSYFYKDYKSKFNI
jgi:hypothetical protein